MSLSGIYYRLAAKLYELKSGAPELRRCSRIRFRLMRVANYLNYSATMLAHASPYNYTDPPVSLSMSCVINPRRADRMASPDGASTQRQLRKRPLPPQLAVDRLEMLMLNKTPSCLGRCHAL